MPRPAGAVDLTKPPNSVAISRIRGNPQRRVVVPQVLSMSLWGNTNILDSERRYASTSSDSTIERTLQFTMSSMDFHISLGTALSPASPEQVCKSWGDGLNHTSRSFSGPVAISHVQRGISPTDLTFECIARIKI